MGLLLRQLLLVISLGLTLASPKLLARLALTTLSLAALATLLTALVATGARRRSVSIMLLHWAVSCSAMLTTMSRCRMHWLSAIRAGEMAGIRSHSMRSLLMDRHHLVGLRMATMARGSAMNGSLLGVTRLLSMLSTGPSSSLTTTMCLSTATVRVVGVGILRAFLFVVVLVS